MSGAPSNQQLRYLVGVGATLLILTGCGHSTAHTTVQAQQPTNPGTGPTTPARGGDARFEEVAPARAVPPLATTGDRVSGMFTWTVDDTGSSYVEHTDSDGSVTNHWTLTPPSQGGPAGRAAVTLRQAPNGDVWLGTQMTLVRLRPHTSEVVQWTIPKLPVSPVASASRPLSTGDVQYVTDLDFRLANTVVAGVAEANVLVTFDPRTETFGQVGLPGVGEATAVATAPDGALAVGMSNYQSHTWDPSGPSKSPNGRPWHGAMRPRRRFTHWRTK